ncbi:MAG TPA: ribosome biogenesis GTP-binding protein YihA/YsxC, partial [Nitrospirota bacterium]|nr:ribosome biogenesis GTP-binding protein YihA/YsxC [Nitrospirota bacterium]
RSNVGKSSLINNLVNRKGLVKTSSTPGKTREINFFLINGALYFVDLPGYGYARVPGKVQEGWGPMLEEYLKRSPMLRLVVVLLDVRHGPQRNDLIMHGWLKDNKIPAAYVATKADKISRGVRPAHIKKIADALGAPGSDIIEFSAVTGEGKGRLWERISASIA